MASGAKCGERWRKNLSWGAFLTAERASCAFSYLTPALSKRIKYVRQTGAHLNLSTRRRMRKPRAAFCIFTTAAVSLSRASSAFLVMFKITGNLRTHGMAKLICNISEPMSPSLHAELMFTCSAQSIRQLRWRAPPSACTLLLPKMCLLSSSELPKCA